MECKKVGWIDIHSHILPSADNGAVNLEQTIKMLKMAHSLGINHIIATPHYGVGCRNAEIEELYKKLELVRRQAENIHKDFRIDLGNELYYSEDIIQHLRKKKALTLAGTRYVLVKFPETENYTELKAGLHRLLIYGYLPILSQAETYHCLYENYERIYDLIRLGVYMQMNLSSISHRIGSKERNHAKNLIDYGFIHMFGTNSHSVAGNSDKIKKGLHLVKKRYKESVLAELFTENALKMLKNQYI